MALRKKIIIKKRSHKLTYFAGYALEINTYKLKMELLRIQRWYIYHIVGNLLNNLGHYHAMNRACVLAKYPLFLIFEGNSLVSLYLHCLVTLISWLVVFSDSETLYPKKPSKKRVISLIRLPWCILTRFLKSNLMSLAPYFNAYNLYNPVPLFVLYRALYTSIRRFITHS